MNIFINFVKKIWFKKRSLDWWYYTFLPLLLVFFISASVYIFIGGNMNDIFFTMAQQIIFYAVILSSTEQGLRSKVNQNNQFAYSTAAVNFVLIFGSIYLMLSYLFINVIYNHSKSLMIISLFVLIIPIWMSNHNPNSGMPDESVSDTYNSLNNSTISKVDKRISSNNTDIYGGVKI